jgi:hypothetical protein
MIFLCPRYRTTLMVSLPLNRMSLRTATFQCRGPCLCLRRLSSPVYLAVMYLCVDPAFSSSNNFTVCWFVKDVVNSTFLPCLQPSVCYLTAEAVNEVRKEWNETMLAFLEVLGLIQVRDSSTGKVTSCRLDECGSTLILTTSPNFIEESSSQLASTESHL